MCFGSIQSVQRVHVGDTQSERLRQWDCLCLWERFLPSLLSLVSKNTLSIQSQSRKIVFLFFARRESLIDLELIDSLFPSLTLLTSYSWSLLNYLLFRSCDFDFINNRLVTFLAEVSPSCLQVLCWCVDTSLIKLEETALDWTLFYTALITHLFVYFVCFSW